MQGPYTGRAFYVRALNNEQIAKLRASENQLHPGRFLIGSEIQRMFNMAPVTATQAQLQTMEDLWQDFEKRVLWKQRKIEDKEHDTKCARTPKGQWCKCKKPQEEMHQWEDFMLANYRTPQVAGKKLSESLEEPGQPRWQGY